MTTTKLKQRSSIACVEIAKLYQEDSFVKQKSNRFCWLPAALLAACGTSQGKFKSDSNGFLGEAGLFLFADTIRSFYPWWKQGDWDYLFILIIRTVPSCRSSTPDDFFAQVAGRAPHIKRLQESILGKDMESRTALAEGN